MTGYRLKPLDASRGFQFYFVPQTETKHLLCADCGKAAPKRKKMSTDFPQAKGDMFRGQFPLIKETSQTTAVASLVNQPGHAAE